MLTDVSRGHTLSITFVSRHFRGYLSCFCLKLGMWLHSGTLYIAALLLDHHCAVGVTSAKKGRFWPYFLSFLPLTNLLEVVLLVSKGMQIFWIPWVHFYFPLHRDIHTQHVNGSYVTISYGMYKELIKTSMRNGKNTSGSCLLVRLGDLLLEWRGGGDGDRVGGEREGERVR